MKRIAMVVNGVVENIAAWDGVATWNPGNQYTLVDVTAQRNVDIGWVYSSGNFTPPVTP